MTKILKYFICWAEVLAFAIVATHFSSQNGFAGTNVNCLGPSLGMLADCKGREHPVGTGPAALPIAKLPEHTSDFDFAIYRKLAEKNASNLIFSPLSVKLVFAMLDQGAKGETHLEISHVMSSGENTSAFVLKTASVAQPKDNRECLSLKLQITDCNW